MENIHAKDCKELYDWYRSNGICVKCGRVWAEPGRVRCRTCAKKMNTQHRKADPDGAWARKRMQELRAERRLDGLCVDCGMLTDGIHTRCAKCLEKNRQASERRAIRKRIKERTE